DITPQLATSSLGRLHHLLELDEVEAQSGVERQVGAARKMTQRTDQVQRLAAGMASGGLRCRDVFDRPNEIRDVPRKVDLLARVDDVQSVGLFELYGLEGR